MKVLVIAAHPDDEVLGAGGAIAKWASQGGEVHIHVLTEGSSSQYPGQSEMVTRKKDEARRAATILGARGLSFSDFPDMQLDRVPHVDLNRAIQGCLAEVNPQVVLTPYPDVNKDHCLTFESTLVAVRPLAGCGVKEVLAYPVASGYEWAAPFPSPPFHSNVFVDIGQTLETKVKAFECYQSEARDYPHPRSGEAIRLYARKTGVTVGLEAAEGFVLIRRLE